MNPGYYQADRTATASKKRRILCFIDCLALRIKCSAAVFSAAGFVRTLNDADTRSPKPQEHTIRGKRQEEIQAERDRKLGGRRGNSGNRRQRRVTDETDYFRIADHPPTELRRVESYVFWKIEMRSGVRTEIFRPL